MAKVILSLVILVMISLVIKIPEPSNPPCHGLPWGYKIHANGSTELVCL